MDIDVEKVPSNISIKGMVTKPVRVTTEGVKTVYEDNLQLELQNLGKKPLSFIDCTLSYRASNDSFLGSDSDGTFDELQPNDTCVVSIPIFIPEGTTQKKLVITCTEVDSKFSKYSTFIFVGIGAVLWVVTKFIE